VRSDLIKKLYPSSNTGDIKGFVWNNCSCLFVGWLCLISYLLPNSGKLVHVELRGKKKDTTESDKEFPQSFTQMLLTMFQVLIVAYAAA